MSNSNQLQLRSMTGFGRARGAGVRGRAIEVEIKSLNHRFSEVICKLPREYSGFESEVRATVLRSIKRGRVEVFIQRRATEGTPSTTLAPINQVVFDQYLTLFRGLIEKNGIFDPLFVNQLVIEIFRLPGVFSSTAESAEVDEIEKREVIEVLEAALSNLIQSRTEEGSRLGIELSKALDLLSENCRSFREELPAILSQTQLRLKERLLQFAPEVKLDEARLAMEVLMLVEKADIREELDRLNSHLAAANLALTAAGEGRRLDFLAQEMGRELTTISAKVDQVGQSARAIESKVILERFREQVQNLE